MRLVVGPGNPGPRYAATRHNIGMTVADALVERASERYKVHKRSGADIATVSVAGTSVLIARPRVFMNEAGRQIGPLASFFSIAPDDVIVVHDELDIDFGQVRLKRGGGEGGHNGLRSISAALGSRDYLRVRLGIGRPPGRQDPADFVLKPFASAQRTEVDLLVENGIDAVDLLLTTTLEEAQNRVHAW